MTDRSTSIPERIKHLLRVVPDFPTPGVRFIDIAPVIADAELLPLLQNGMAEPFIGAGITHVLGIETRGLFFAGAIAAALDAGLVAVRKPGKLPPPVLAAKGTIMDSEQVGGLATIDPSRGSTYQKPYEFQIAKDLIGKGSRVLVVDDLLAKGGSLHACANLVRQADAEIAGASFVIELAGLGGRRVLEGTKIHALVSL